MAIAPTGPRAPAREDGRPTSVFWIAVALTAVFVAAGALLTDPVDTALADVVGAVVTNGGWL